MSSYSNSAVCGGTRPVYLPEPNCDGRSQIERRLDEQAAIIDELENVVGGLITRGQYVSSPCSVGRESLSANKTEAPTSVLQQGIEGSTRRLRLMSERIQDAICALEI